MFLEGEYLMRKDMVNTVIEKTRQILESFWNKEVEPLDDFLSDEVIYIGPFSGQFVHGKKETLDLLKGTMDELTSCELRNEEFYPIVNENHTCVVCGRYISMSNKNNKELFYQGQRVTVIWVLTKDKELKITHIHLSSGNKYYNGNKEFPQGLSKLAYNYLQDQIYANKNNDLIHVKDDKKQIRLISLGDIEYAMALGHDTVIYMNNENIHAKITWKNFLELLDNRFIQVHRSYVIQKSCVKLIGKKFLEMQSGDKIPVPAKNMKSVFYTLTQKKEKGQ